MKRRGFLGFMGGAAVAGPGMVKKAAAQGIEALAVSPMVPINASAFSSAVVASNGPIGPQDEYDPIGWAKRDLARFFGKSAAQLLRERQSINVQALDPDLAAMRSLSLDAKVRIQRDRLFRRNQEAERGWLEQRLEDLMKQVAA